METYDPSVHYKNGAGRWVSKETHKLVTLDPATIPSAAAAAPALPADEALAGVLPPPVPQAVPPQAPPPQAPPPQAADFQAAAREGAFGKPAGSLDGAAGEAGFSFADLPGDGGAPLPHEALAHAHVPGCYAGGAQGRMCACGVMVYDPMPDDEAKMAATMALSMLNRVMPNPFPPDDEERDAWAAGFKMISVKYGNPIGKYGPEIALALAVVPSVVARRQKASSGEKAREKAREALDNDPPTQEPMRASSSRSPFSVFDE